MKHCRDFFRHPVPADLSVADCSFCYAVDAPRFARSLGGWPALLHALARATQPTSSPAGFAHAFHVLAQMVLGSPAGLCQRFFGQFLLLRCISYRPLFLTLVVAEQPMPVMQPTEAYYVHCLSEESSLL